MGGNPVPAQQELEISGKFQSGSVAKVRADYLNPYRNPHGWSIRPEQQLTANTHTQTEKSKQ